ncbi:MAG: hypothetical protein IKO17_07415 [Prevotella sp.]|nr:hypothetical protein [Prevotella sp.]
MRKITGLNHALMALGVLLSGTMFFSCSTDENIDLSDLDTTIGIGSDGFTLPTSSTKNSPLGDLLKFEEDDCIDTLANGDYQFVKSDNISPATPKVKEVSFVQDNLTAQNIPFGITAAMAYDKANSIVNSYTLPETGVPTTIATFNFSDPAGNSQIVKINKADINGGISLDINFPDIANMVNKMSMDVYIPKFFTFDETGKNIDKTSDANYNIVKITNHNTSTAYHLALSLTNIENIDTETPAKESYVVVNPNTINMHGLIKVLMHFTTNDIITTTPGSKDITIANMNLGNANHEFVITRAEGWFNPDINIDDKNTQISSVPDFLTDERVHIMLENPTIKIEIENNVDMEAMLKGVLTANYKDGTKRKLNLTKNKDIVMKRQSITPKTTIYINRKGGTDDATTSYIQVNTPGITPLGGNLYEVFDMDSILTKIPESLDFTFTAEANHDTSNPVANPATTIDLYANDTTTVKRGLRYEIKPSYEFTAPLALENGSIIVYTDTLDNINKDLKDQDINLYEGSHVLIESDIHNSTPLELLITSPKAIGVKDNNGNAPVITDCKVELIDNNGNVLNGGLTVYKKGDPKNKKLRLKVSGNLKNFDGIVLEVMASAKQPTAETLNASKHRVQLENIKINLNGRISLDLDK